MDLQELYGQQLLKYGELSLTLGELLQIVGAVGGLCLLGYLILVKWLPRFYNREDTTSELRPRARRVILSGVVIFSLIAILRVLELDFELFKYEVLDPDSEEYIFRINIRISTLMKALLTLVVAGLVDWSVEEFLVQRYHRQRSDEANSPSEEDMARRISGVVRPVVYGIAVLLIASDIGVANYVLLTFGAENGEQTYLRVHNAISAFVVLSIIRLVILIVTRFALAGYYKRANVDSGSQYALDRLLTYFAYLIGVLLVLQTAGFSLLGIWTGAAALLVGIGIGLQQTFNDLICGIIILFERSVKVGDVLDMGGPEKVGTVRKIGTRTSQVVTRDNILLYVPNSKLIGDSVVNWSQARNRTRFRINVGVAYGSDTSLVKKILMEVAEKHGKVLKNPKPNVRFLEFGDSSLNFCLLFFVKKSDFERVEDIRSDLRFLIDNGFRAYGVEIPFPQRDLWIKNAVNVASPATSTKKEALPEEAIPEGEEE